MAIETHSLEKFYEDKVNIEVSCEFWLNAQDVEKMF